MQPPPPHNHPISLPAGDGQLHLGGRDGACEWVEVPHRCHVLQWVQDVLLHGGALWDLNKSPILGRGLGKALICLDRSPNTTSLERRAKGWERSGGDAISPPSLPPSPGVFFSPRIGIGKLHLPAKQIHGGSLRPAALRGSRARPTKTPQPKPCALRPAQRALDVPLLLQAGLGGQRLPAPGWVTTGGWHLGGVSGDPEAHPQTGRSIRSSLARERRKEGTHDLGCTRG